MKADANRPDRDPDAADRRSVRTQRPTARFALNLLLAIASIGCTFVVLELALRVYHGTVFDFSSQLVPPPNRAENPVAQYDSLLGWVPRPGTHERTAEEKWSVNEGGLRNNGLSATSRDERPIVVAGDSFTFGDEVMDGETWPARLEAMVGVPVINGGVFAYGLDQAYLRATLLIEAYDPAVVLLAFISDDIARAELAFYSGWKPYFEHEDGELVLRNVPVPTGTLPAPRFAGVRKVLSYSYVCSAVLRRVAREWWSYGASVRVHADGDAVALDLFDRLATLARSRNADFAVVALATSGRIGGNQRAASIVERARQQGIAVLDLLPDVERMPPDSVSDMFEDRGHYSPRMNGHVAARIAAFLEERR